MYENLSQKMTFEKVLEYTKLRFRDVLFNQAYDVIAHELTDVDFQFLYAMAQDNSISSIIRTMQKSKQYVNSYRAKLIKYDLIKPIIRGKVGFTLPLFRDFIQAKYDELNWG
ncbi:hypothetical protein [Lactobacillus crispatus]